MAENAAEAHFPRIPMHAKNAEQDACAGAQSDEQADHGALISDEQILEQHLRPLPKECGVALMGFGIVGVMLLDPVDILFVVAGALVFSPRLFQRSEHWLQRRFPKTHRVGRRQMDRFLDDFEGRYPPDS
jgi:hypothetical protein